MKEAVEFRPQAQLVFAGNALPDLGKLDAATQRRIAIMHFLRRIPDEEQINDLGLRIVAEEQDALLAAAIAGASRVIANGWLYDVPPSSAALITTWTEQTDPVLDFCRQCIVRDERSFLRSSRDDPLYDKFLEWASKEGWKGKDLPRKHDFTKQFEGYFKVRKGRDSTGHLFGYKRLRWRKEEEGGSGFLQSLQFLTALFLDRSGTA